jgi:prevent-host-death family protein
MPITVPASIARTQLGSLLKQLRDRKTRFVITKGGKPAAVLLDVADFDDIVEELDPAFQRTLKAARREHQSGKSITLRDYLRHRIAARRAK